MYTVYHSYSDEEKAVEFLKKLNVCDTVIVHTHLQGFELRNQAIIPYRTDMEYCLTSA